MLGSRMRIIQLMMSCVSWLTVFLRLPVHTLTCLRTPPFWVCMTNMLRTNMLRRVSSLLQTFSLVVVLCTLLSDLQAAADLSGSIHLDRTDTRGHYVITNLRWQTCAGNFANALRVQGLRFGNNMFGRLTRLAYRLGVRHTLNMHSRG